MVRSRSSVQSRPSAQNNNSALKAELLLMVGIERERGRENGSFPVTEILKPMGFKTQSPITVGPSSEIPDHRLIIKTIPKRGIVFYCGVLNLKKFGKNVIQKFTRSTS